MVKVTSTVLLITLLAFQMLTYAAVPDGCLSPEEKKLAQLINEYRDDNNLPSVLISKSLTQVSQWHTIDLFENSPTGGACNNHSWSAARPDLWTAVCYTADHAHASGMWYKPREITGGTYTDNGFENIYWHSSSATAVGAFTGWKNSRGHRETILEQGIWRGMRWQSMGIGIYKNYAALWFGKAADPQGGASTCTAGGSGNSAGSAQNVLTPVMQLLLSVDN